MPVRRRKGKRLARIDEHAAWSDVFECQYDFFGELPSIGVKTDQYDLPDPKVAAEAWQRLGAAFMAEWRSRPHHPDESEPWALTTFGEPPCR